jgi:hypothetical protein
MALTITNHLVRIADAPHTAGFGDGAGIVIRLPAGVLTGGPNRHHSGRLGGHPDPADCNPEVYDEGFWSRLDAWGARFGLTRPAGIVCRHPWCPGRVMAWPAAGYNVLAAGDLRGEEDEQA